MCCLPRSRVRRGSNVQRTGLGSCANSVHASPPLVRQVPAGQPPPYRRTAAARRAAIPPRRRGRPRRATLL